MSDFRELIKSFPKTREYVRDFFVYGFKTRDEFKEKSPRTYDNERRRIESWLAGFVKQDYTEKGKNISLGIDSNLLDTNPLYRVWKTKSFTDNDIMLHFFLLDFLSDKKGLTIETITDGILDTYDVFFDVQMVRRKCNAYVKEGILQKEKQGKELLYRKNPDFQNILNTFPMLENAIRFYQFSTPLGIAGNTILDTVSMENHIFRVKHSFFVHTLEDEVLLDILEAMQEHCMVRLFTKSSKNSKELIYNGVPLQIFISTRTGRRFCCLYSVKSRRFHCLRMDSIKKAEITKPAEDYDELRAALERNHPYIWGVSFENGQKQHTETVKLTLHILEDSEAFIIERLKREGKGGIITHIGRNTYTYEKEVFDSNEMLPWIRTFTGRIIDINCSHDRLKNRFYGDMENMYRLYDI
ncbi:MAG: WYL domain-containing protein [Lachnospiraceae bacterium]|nr:WYL domain-containing protein [Lachnospiraceae bacterium]